MKNKLYHQIIYPEVKVEGKNPCLILLHGRGADENDLIGLKDYIDKRFLILSVRAPFEWDFGLGYTWFEMGNDFKPDIKTLNDSINLLKEFINFIPTEYKIDEKKIFTFGFSMGAVMGNLLATLFPDIIYANISHSGYLPEISKNQYKNIPAKPIFIAHGIYDPVIPIALGRETKQVFNNLQADVLYKEYPIEHHICEESINDISNWMKELLDRK